MKKVAIIISVIVVIAAFGTYYFYKTSRPIGVSNKPNSTLQKLKEGNVRFVSDKSQHQDYQSELKSDKIAQHPNAIVLNCTDSPSIPEIIFDQGIGNIYTIRVAGNVINSDILGTMEYGTKEEGAALIVVLGHTHCSTMEAACKGEKIGNLTNLLQKIQPAVKTVETTALSKKCNNTKLIDAIAKQNVINMMKQIPQKSPVIASLVKSGHVKIVGGIYNSATGSVIFTGMSS